LPAIAKLTTGFPSEIILVRPVGGTWFILGDMKSVKQRPVKWRVSNALLKQTVDGILVYTLSWHLQDVSFIWSWTVRVCTWILKLGVDLLVMTIWLELCTYYSSGCHHQFHHPFLSASESRMETFWYRLTQIYLENGCLNRDRDIMRHVFTCSV